jgi:hypothetical protein
MTKTRLEKAMETMKMNRSKRDEPPLTRLDATLKARYLATASSVERANKPRRSTIPPTHTKI